MTLFAAEVYKDKRARGESRSFIEIVEGADEDLKKYTEEIDDDTVVERSSRVKEDDREALTNYLLSNTEADEDRYSIRKDPLHRYKTNAPLDANGHTEIPVSFSDHRLKEHGLDTVIDDVRDYLRHRKR